MKAMLILAALTVAGAAAAQTLHDLQWAKRILIVFASSENSQLLEQRERLLAHESALAERDMLVFAVLGNGSLQPIYGEPPAEKADALRNAYGVSAKADFAAVLVGKDGGVKWRGDAPADTNQLFALIDAMPMRRSGD